MGTKAYKKGQMLKISGDGTGRFPTANYWRITKSEIMNYLEKNENLTSKYS